MNDKQMNRMHTGNGFIAALDQSGGSTPKALEAYGIHEDAYDSETTMFQLVHEMRSRIIKSPAFTHERILAAILFERTMDSFIEKEYTADYLWNQKKIVPFLKIDKGLADLKNGVQLMKPIPNLDNLLDRALERNIFGTKMRSVIKEFNSQGINQIVDQQFDLALQISQKGLVPIVEPEVDIHCPDKEQSEQHLLKQLQKGLDKFKDEKQVIFKLTIPSKPDLYKPLIEDPRVVRVVALSGGYSREEANEKLSANKGLIASFSRALSEGLSVKQSDEEFNSQLDQAIASIYEASLS